MFPLLAYVMTTSKLALEYARLGKHTRAAALFNVTRATMDKVEYCNGLSDNDLAEISLRYALYLAWAGDAEKSYVKDRSKVDTKSN